MSARASAAALIVVVMAGLGCQRERPAPASQPASAPAAPSPQPAQRGLAADGQLQPSPADRCPVCAMRPANHPKQAAGLTLEDGRTFYFCGNQCLLRAYQNPQRYLGVAADAVERLSVLDYFSGQPIDGRTAFWIRGADVSGPMGPAVVPLSKASEVAPFRKRHGGEAPFQLEPTDDR
ncbi:MAG: nitrous oxide reductase accessory protein NosL [Myxococcota bacterium]